MTVTHPVADDSANGQPAPTSGDRFFLAVNGELQGPLTRAELSQVEATAGAWLWSIGQPDWTPFGSQIMEIDEQAKGASYVVQLAGAWQSLRRRGHAARLAAALELRARQVRRALDAHRQELDDLHLSIGREAIDSDNSPPPQALLDLHRSGIDLVARISAIDTTVAKGQQELDRLDPKSPAAARVRGVIAGHKKSRSAMLTNLRAVQRDLGQAVQNNGASRDRFPQFQAKYTEVQTRMASASDELRSLEREQAAADIEIGTSFRKLLSVVGVFLVLALALVLFWPFGSRQGPPTASTTGLSGKQLSQPALPAAVPGLTRPELGLAAALVITEWKAWPSVDSGCTGSAAVFATLPDGMLALMTNRHVLGLKELIAAETPDGIRVTDYRVRVRFPSGRICPVLKIRPEATNVDLAVLYVDARTLQPGVDYVLVPVVPAATDLQPGDEVVAIGNPGTDEGILENTQTFGHVSALRERVTDGVSTQEIQIDAALNHGNSGGPLMVKSSDRYYWAGINTAGWSPAGGYQGLNFAIRSRQAMSLNYYDYDANANGAAALLKQIYRVNAIPRRP